MAPARILLVEDDDAIGSSLESVLRERGFETAWHRTGRDAIAEAARQTPDIVLLDLGLPDLDGVDVCRLIRAAHPGLPIMILTARDAEVDVVLGLNAGANDYVTKPFRLGELFARITAHLRHADRKPNGTITIGDIEIDDHARRVTRGGIDLVLRAREYDLLTLLARNAGKALTRERILAELWDDHWGGSSKSLDMHVSTLRRRLGPPDPITTLRGVGYRLDR